MSHYPCSSILILFFYLNVLTQTYKQRQCLAFSFQFATSHTAQDEPACWQYFSKALNSLLNFKHAIISMEPLLHWPVESRGLLSIPPMKSIFQLGRQKRLLPTISQGRSVIHSYHQATWAFEDLWKQWFSGLLDKGITGYLKHADSLNLGRTSWFFMYQTVALSISTFVSQSSPTQELNCIHMHRNRLKLFLESLRTTNYYKLYSCNHMTPRG